jgi:ATP-dependent DNA helicase MPH1
MPPPALPARFTSAASLRRDEEPEPSFDVGWAKKKMKKRAVSLDSSPLAEPPPSQRGLKRLNRRRSSSPAAEDADAEEDKEEGPSSAPRARPAKRLKRARRPLDAAAARFFVDGEAGHSGDETEEGSSGEDSPESESDRRFLRENPATQASPSYAQTQVYRTSLLTQAPGHAGPDFARRLVRPGRFGPNRTPVRRAPGVSSSPAMDDGEPDEYEHGSFIVHDDEDIVYDDDSSQV